MASVALEGVPRRSGDTKVFTKLDLESRHLLDGQTGKRI
jgi:hypothetical protein